VAVEKIQKETFKKGSKTYFNSSLFFPKRVREDVFILYAFVRTADNFVDAIPQDPDGFYDFRNRYEVSRDGKSSGDIIIDSFVDLADRKRFDPAWTDAFLDSMEMDLTKTVYTTLEETLRYIYGSAEVIGLYMARIMGLPGGSHRAAKMLGRAMQYINFIRDIDEDISLGRTYLPLSDSGLTSLQKSDVAASESKIERFISFIRKNIDLYYTWQKQAEEGYRYIPRRYLIPIKTAADMYGWTASVIRENPLIVYEKKIKPSKLRVLFTVLKNAVNTGPQKGEEASRDE
jgi:phytoene synthase